MSAGALTSEWTPRLLEMEAELSRHLPGEPEVVRRTAHAIRRKVALLPDEPCPLGRLLAVGPNHQARKLAEGLASFLFGDEGQVLTLNMGDYATEDRVERLVGYVDKATAAYLDGELTEPIRLQPRTVVVLEEIERAHAAFYPWVVRIMEEGTLIDGAKRVIPFKDAIIILTTMVGYVPGRLRPEWVKQDDGSCLFPSFPQDSIDALRARFWPEVLRLINDILLVR
jgi:ATP-dependent Clp protease ATP-binding subunit ClpA